jgi:predicted small metal-binding protein
MTRQVRCECGYVARDETDEAVVDKIMTHLNADHPDLATTVTRTDVASWIELIPS